MFNEFRQAALAGTRATKFVPPANISLIPVNRKTGMQAAEIDPETIIEAFKPGTGPADTYWVIGMDAGGEMGGALSPAAAGAIQGGGGGLY